MLALIPLLASLVAAPAPAQNNPFGPSQGQLDQARQNANRAAGTNAMPTDNPEYKRLVADQQKELRDLDAKQQAEYKAALANPRFTSKARAAALNKANLPDRLKLELDLTAATAGRKKGFEELSARHAQERGDLSRKQASDREWKLVQISWQSLNARR